MAQIIFQGPNPSNPDVSGVTTVNIPDETMMAAVEAICGNCNYAGLVANNQFPVGPAEFAIRETLTWWTNHIRQYQNIQAVANIPAQVEAAVTNLVAPIQIIPDQIM